MQKKTLIAVAVAGALSIMTLPVALGAVINNRAAEIVGYNVGADPMLAVESNRSGIISRLIIEHRGALDANSINESAFRNALASLRADQLLVASLVGTLEEVSSIVAAQQVEGATLARFVAVAPTIELASMPAAEAYLVREGEQMSIVKASQLQLNANTQLVGYFVAGTSAGLVTTTRGGELMPKDGSGSGASSWIGYTAGGNQATGTSSAVAAGSNNLASGQNSFVGAGFANQANGTSSLVIGGFDNRATNIDSLVGAGAGHRATGARSVIVGGGYNLASGNFSFIGGGGRDGVGSGAAGTDVNRDHRAYGKWSVIGGGTGNVTGVNGSGDGIRNDAVVGGHRNSATGHSSFVGGGGCNVASGLNAAIVGGGQTDDTGPCSFGNLASGAYAFVGAGYDNVASGTSSVALGQGANATDSGSFVFSDGTVYSSNGSSTFNVEASGGLFVSPSTRIQMGSQTRQNITLWGGANEYGLGVQSGTEYFRTGSGFAWFQGGVHNDATFNPGTGGQRLLTLEQDNTMTFGDPANVVWGELLKLNAANQRTIGSQNNTLYFRSSQFCWFRGGVHSDGTCDPGAGGAVAMNLTSGGLSVNGTFVSASDENLKSSFQTVDSKSILAKVASLPISTWVYKEDNGTRHIGPMAQDFKRLFGVGVDDKTISMVDADGIALAAIKGLVEEARERDARMQQQQLAIDSQKATIESQQTLLVAQQQRIASLEEQQSITTAAQLQMLDMAQTLAKLQQEMAQLRRASEVALAPR